MTDIPVSQEDQTESGRRTENTLLGTDDAMVWAEEFCRIFWGKTISNEPCHDDGWIDPGLMVGWFANAMAVGEQFAIKRLDHDPVLWAFEHFRQMDKANACMHCAPVRYSPITFRLAEFLNTIRPTMFLEHPGLAEVMQHRGKYEEDPGR